MRRTEVNNRMLFFFFCFLFQPDLSTGDDNDDDDDRNHLTRCSSSSPMNQSSKPQSTISLNEIEDFNQPDISMNEPVAPLVDTTKCSSSSKQSSQIPSPVPSTSSQTLDHVELLANHEIIQLPMYLERELLIKNNFDQLSKSSRIIKTLKHILNLDLTVDASIDHGINGCCVRSITSTAIDNCLKADDFLTSINNENMRKISNAQARAIIRRAALVGSDIRYFQ